MQNHVWLGTTFGLRRPLVCSQNEVLWVKREVGLVS